MNQILFPDIDCLMILIKCFVAVCQSKKGIVVTRMERKTLLVVIDSILEMVLLSLTILPFGFTLIMSLVSIMILMRKYAIKSVKGMICDLHARNYKCA